MGPTVKPWGVEPCASNTIASLTPPQKPVDIYPPTLGKLEIYPVRVVFFVLLGCANLGPVGCIRPQNFLGAVMHHKHDCRVVHFAALNAPYGSPLSINLELDAHRKGNALFAEPAFIGAEIEIGAD